MDDPTLQTILETLAADNHLGVLLAVQMGGTPEELQLIVQTADFDVEQQAIHPKQVYLFRCLGVQEHRVTLGIFQKMLYVEDHPLLWNHNFPYKQIYFRGTPSDVDSLMLDLNQLFGQHYGPYRTLADNVNRAIPLGTLLNSGHGLLGEMPAPMAEKVKALLERYHLTVNLADSGLEDPPLAFKLLVMDDTYFIAQLYSVEPMQGRSG